VLTAGQTAGGIVDIPGVAELMRRLVAEAEDALVRAPGLVATAPWRAQTAGAGA
jgi:hypothetical protein